MTLFFWGTTQDSCDTSMAHFTKPVILLIENKCTSLNRLTSTLPYLQRYSTLYLRVLPLCHQISHLLQYNICLTCNKSLSWDVYKKFLLTKYYDTLYSFIESPNLCRLFTSKFSSFILRLLPVRLCYGSWWQSSVRCTPDRCGHFPGHSGNPCRSRLLGSGKVFPSVTYPSYA